MKAGRLRARVEFQRQQETKDAYGEKSTTYETFCIRWGEPFGLAAGEEAERYGKSGYMIQKFRVRYDSMTKTVGYADRIKYNGAQFEIVAIENKNNRNEELIFTGAHNERFS